jgi:hypothetical protein
VKNWGLIVVAMAIVSACSKTPLATQVCGRGSTVAAVECPTSFGPGASCAVGTMRDFCDVKTGKVVSTELPQSPVFPNGGDAAPSFARGLDSRCMFTPKPEHQRGESEAQFEGRFDKWLDEMQRRCDQEIAREESSFRRAR